MFTMSLGQQSTALTHMETKTTIVPGDSVNYIHCKEQRICESKIKLLSGFTHSSPTYREGRASAAPVRTPPWSGAGGGRGRWSLPKSRRRRTLPSTPQRHGETGPDGSVWVHKSASGTAR